jgi:hypothetical protein
MFSAATEAWDREQMAQVVSARTVSIPTHQISTTDFGLTKEDADSLYAWGVNAAHDFFAAPDQVAYLNSFGGTLGQPLAAVLPGEPIVLPTPQSPGQVQPTDA